VPPEPDHQQVLQVHRFAMEPIDRPASHTGHALCWILDGAGSFELGHRTRIRARSFVIVPAGVPHRMVSTQARLECWGVGFCATCWELPDHDGLMLPFRGVRLGAPPVVEPAPERVPWIDQLFEELGHEVRQPGPGSATRQRALLVLLLTELRRASRVPDMPGATRVSRALDWIWEHALEPISLRHVAQAVHCSPGHLAKRVKAETGATVGDWIRSTRVAAADAWLLHSDASLDEIASRVGWSDTTHFIRQFRKVHGQTPAAWRRAMRA